MYELGKQSLFNFRALGRLSQNINICHKKGVLSPRDDAGSPGEVRPTGWREAKTGWNWTGP